MILEESSMSELKQNNYGSLCTEMYEILHEQAPQDELDFYLSYAEKGKKILEIILLSLIQCRGIIKKCSFAV